MCDSKTEEKSLNNDQFYEAQENIEDSRYGVEQQQKVFPSKTLHEICKSSLKLQNIEKTIGHETSMLVVDLPTEGVTYQKEMLEEEAANYKVSMKQDKVEKLSKVVKKWNKKFLEKIV